LIYHAAIASAFAMLTHAVAMILADLWVLTITPVGFSALLPPAFMAASLTAVDLPSVAWPTNEKHQPATDSPAKSLSK
jgi:hypothetical protein